MKKYFLSLFFLLGLCSFATAQENKEVLPLTDADWTRYAQVELLTATFLNKKTEELKNLVRTKEGLGGGARFNELQKAWGNPKKEVAIQLTETEKKAYKEVLAAQDSLQKAVVAYQADLIRNDKMLGIALFTQISTVLLSDPSLQEKLNQEVKRLKKKKP